MQEENLNKIEENKQQKNPSNQFQFQNMKNLLQTSDYEYGEESQEEDIENIQEMRKITKQQIRQELRSLKSQRKIEINELLPGMGSSNDSDYSEHLLTNRDKELEQQKKNQNQALIIEQNLKNLNIDREDQVLFKEEKHKRNQSIQKQAELQPIKEQKLSYQKTHQRTKTHSVIPNIIPKNYIEQVKPVPKYEPFEDGSNAEEQYEFNGQPFVQQEIIGQQEVIYEENPNDDIDALTGISAMEGIQGFASDVLEVNLTVSKIAQDGHFEQQSLYKNDPQTGNQFFDKNLQNKVPIGISRHYQVGNQLGNEQVSSNSAQQQFTELYALLSNAELGIQVKLPLRLIPRDVGLGNIVTLTVQRNPIEETKRHSDILSIQQHFLNNFS